MMKSIHVSKFQHRNPFLKNLENMFQDQSNGRHPIPVTLWSAVLENMKGVLC